MAICTMEAAKKKNSKLRFSLTFHSYMSRRPRLLVQQEEASEDPVQAAIAAKKAKQGAQHVCCNSLNS